MPSLGVILSTENLRAQNFGRELVFSADFCYNGADEKPLSEGSLKTRVLLEVWALPEAFVIQRRNRRDIMEQQIRI